MVMHFHTSMKFAFWAMMLSICLLTLGACERGAGKAQSSRPDCAETARFVIEMVKDRDSTFIPRAVKIEDLEIIEKTDETLTCRGKGTFTDGNVAPIIVRANLYNGKWSFTSKQGSGI